MLTDIKVENADDWTHCIFANTKAGHKFFSQVSVAGDNLSYAPAVFILHVTRVNKLAIKSGKPFSHFLGIFFRY